MIYNVYVRGKDARGKWRNINVVDLTQDSFNMFVAQMLCRAGIAVGVKQEADFVYHTRKIIKDSDED